MLRFVFALLFVCAGPVAAISSVPAAAAQPCASAIVFEDRNRNGSRDPGEPPLPDVLVSDGEAIVGTDAQGRFRLPAGSGARTVFVIKPAGFAFAQRADGLPDAWRNVRAEPGPILKYGGIPTDTSCRDIGLRREAQQVHARDALRLLVFGDPQPKYAENVDYYARDIVEPIVAGAAAARNASRGDRGVVADLGLTLGDIVDDDLALYPSMTANTAKLGIPWLHAPGNHDMDFDAASDEDSLLTFRHHFGPDTLAWEEPEANVVMLDNVIYLPGKKTPAYIGGLRGSQFAFLQRYLAQADRKRLLVLAMHIPLFEDSERDTFRDDHRERLFALLRDFPKVLVLSAHKHTQRHVYHDARSGWHGAKPLHEYNVGATCGAFWSGVKDAAGIPAATMADGTPNGYARLDVARDGSYRLSWHSARGQGGDGIGLHAPRVLRRDAYPAYGVYANVYMGRDDTRVEYRVDGAEWKKMRKVVAPDPALLAENALDNAAPGLRGYDRSPEATPSMHLWRAALPTDLAAGEHVVEVRAIDPWWGEQRVSTRYRLQDAQP